MNEAPAPVTVPGPSESSAAPPASAPAGPSGLRYYGGWLFFLASFFMPLFGLLVPMLGLDKATTAIIAGALVVGGPEVCVVVAIALWGKETFNYFLGRATGALRVLLPKAEVSAARYRVGLVLLFASGLPSWLLAYFPQWVDDRSRMPILATADLVFIFSFYVLGGNFWGKVRALFTHP